MTTEHFWSVAVETINKGGGRKGLGKRHLWHSQQIHPSRGLRDPWIVQKQGQEEGKSHKSPTSSIQQ